MVSLVFKVPQVSCQTSPHTENRPRSVQKNGTGMIRVKTLDGCNLRISSWNFDYNAQGGRGTGRRIRDTNVKEQNGNDKDYAKSPARYEVDLRTLHIPAVNAATAKVDGWAPFPPFVNVEIVPQFLEGIVYEDSRKVELVFKAYFDITIGNHYKAPPLLVDTVLTSEETKGAIFRTTTRGERLRRDGSCKLVGISKVNPVADPYINAVLGLPSECLASLNFHLSFF